MGLAISSLYSDTIDLHAACDLLLSFTKWFSVPASDDCNRIHSYTGTRAVTFSYDEVTMVLEQRWFVPVLCWEHLRMLHLEADSSKTSVLTKDTTKCSCEDR